jgi:hypothetical protein
LFSSILILQPRLQASRQLPRFAAILQDTLHVKGRSHHLAMNLHMSGVDMAEVSRREHDELGDAY